MYLNENLKSKVFIVSLPRTGTTSTCVFFLEQGCKVAHTAFNSRVIESADVVADTPVYVDYAQLHLRYPEAKFVYLERPIDQWLLSIRRLLKSMRKQFIKDVSVFDSEIVRCFNSVFPEFYRLANMSDDYLMHCQEQHKAAVRKYFGDKKSSLLIVDITSEKVCSELNAFCFGKTLTKNPCHFPHVNKNRRITYWDDIDHQNKITP